MPYPHPARHLTASLAAPPRVDAISVRGNNPHRVALRSRSGGAARSHSRSIARVRSIARSKAMTTQSRSELATPPHGLVQPTREALLGLISSIPASSENRVADAATRARRLTTTAALKAATISESLALP